mmetsp:Transcript_6841/g.28561  ORF Transcript_6841/g.28561 Transcript_6841/m.28561 type:complete len:247 (+) Transcript_6841:475-1215(+)
MGRKICSNSVGRSRKRARCATRSSQTRSRSKSSAAAAAAASSAVDASAAGGACVATSPEAAAAASPGGSAVSGCRGRTTHFEARSSSFKKARFVTFEGTKSAGRPLSTAVCWSATQNESISSERTSLSPTMRLRADSHVKQTCVGPSPIESWRCSSSTGGSGFSADGAGRNSCLYAPEASVMAAATSSARTSCSGAGPRTGLCHGCIALVLVVEEEEEDSVALLVAPMGDGGSRRSPLVVAALFVA